MLFKAIIALFVVDIFITKTRNLKTTKVSFYLS
jgi:hypothetical protein